MRKNTPENLEVFATHGSHTLPPKLKNKLDPTFNDRLQKNFSDYATRELLTDLPPTQTLTPRYGRIFGDPNRAQNAPDLFREQDFGGINIWRTPLTPTEKTKALRESYIPYHRELLHRILAPHGHTSTPLYAFDLHDTGNRILGTTPDQDQTRLQTQGWEMPPVIISTVDGTTTSPETTTDLVSAFEKEFHLTPADIWVNQQFKGGHVTKTYGNPTNPDLTTAHHPTRHFFQIELNRGLYVDEETQEINKKRITEVRQRLTQVLTDIAGSSTHDTHTRH